MAFCSAFTPVTLGASLRNITTRWPGSRMASLRNGLCATTPSHSFAVRTKKSVLSARRFSASASSRRSRVGGRSPVRVEEEIPALEQRPDVGETESREEIAQVGHRDLLVAADIDAAEEGDIGGHGCAEPRVIWLSSRSPPLVPRGLPSCFSSHHLLPLCR